jgi:hypothetical protein
MSEIIRIDSLSKRNRHAVEGVIERLPHDWNIVKSQLPKRVTFLESSESPEVPHGCAVTLFGNDSPFRQTVTSHTVILYTRNISLLSIEAVRWVIAHELGHVVRSHLSVRFGNHEESDDEWADRQAMRWGFDKEREAWKQEEEKVLNQNRASEE